MDKLAQLKTMTEVVADTGDIAAIRQFQPVDATTNPSLLLKAAAMPIYEEQARQAHHWAKKVATSSEDMASLCADKFAVSIGTEILGMIPGRVSSEVDARLSFDTSATIARARFLISLYAENNIEQDRVLIKIASTWEGIKAAEVLEREGINCNLTLLFGFPQALACADAGVFLISPFVGRILDWYRAATGEEYDAECDPGVVSVRRIYNYYKAHGYNTVVMGASFRNTGEIEALAGCDRLTIAPPLLQALASDSAVLQRQLAPDAVTKEVRQTLDEPAFRWAVNEDAMVTEKLAGGIRQFATDQIKLEQLLMSETHHD